MSSARQAAIQAGSKDGAGADAALAAMRARLPGTNINEKTLLATDYLNHFNEFVMLLELVADMPDMLDEARGWERKTYCEHFEESAFSDRELAIEAYALSPPEYRMRFDETAARIDSEIDSVFVRVVGAVEEGDADRLSAVVSDGAQSIRGLIDVASAIINGFDHTASQSEVDRLLEG